MKKDIAIDTITIKKYMIDNGYESIISLAKEIDVNRNTLSSVLKGKIRPSSKVMYSLVEKLAIPPEIAGYIFFDY